MSQLILQPFFRFSCVTGSSFTSPGEPPSKPATLVPWFVVEDLPSDRIATLVPVLTVKDCPFAQHSDDDVDYDDGKFHYG